MASLTAAENSYSPESVKVLVFENQPACFKFANLLTIYSDSLSARFRLHLTTFSFIYKQKKGQNKKKRCVSGEVKEQSYNVLVTRQEAATSRPLLAAASSLEALCQKVHFQLSAAV